MIPGIFNVSQNDLQLQNAAKLRNYVHPVVELLSKFLKGKRRPPIAVYINRSSKIASFQKTEVKSSQRTLKQHEESLPNTCHLDGRLSE